jgi:hypothetical protein
LPRKERLLTVAAGVAATLGAFLCAARLVAVSLFVVGGYILLIAPISRRFKLGVAMVALVTVLVVAQSERLQRFTRLADTDAVATRVQGSLNMNLVEVVLEYPAGAGLGSAVGTSIPFFLMHVAPRQIGMENEYGRIALEQSLIGVGLWVAFLGATLLRSPRGRTQQRWRTLISTTRCFVAFSWATALIGTGLLTSIPGTVLLLVGMGLLWNDKQKISARVPVRRAAAPVRAT